MEPTTFLTTGQVCQELNIPRYKLAYLFEQLLIPEPKRIGGRRMFTQDDLFAIKAVLETRNSNKTPISLKKGEI